MLPSITNSRIFWDTFAFAGFDMLYHRLICTKSGQTKIQSFIRNRKNPARKLVMAACYGVLNTFGVWGSSKLIWPFITKGIQDSFKRRKK